MFRFALRGTIEYLESGQLSAPGFLTHAFCTRHGGVSRAPYDGLNVGDLVGDVEEDLLQNLNRVKDAFAIPDGRLILMRQVHGDRIHVIDGDGPLPEGLPECDGLITDRPWTALGIRTADCVPLFFVDRTRRVIGAAHAGWRGTALGIAARMVATFAERFSSRPEDILAVSGPAIGPCCYQVDTPVFDAFSALPGADLFLRPCPGKGRWMLDLALANRLQIRDAGVPVENICVTGLCTACRQDLFFSHRAAGSRTGRQISLIMLSEGNALKNTLQIGAAKRS
jgi:YfiH family protein